MGSEARRRRGGEDQARGWREAGVAGQLVEGVANPAGRGAERRRLRRAQPTEVAHWQQPLAQLHGVDALGVWLQRLQMSASMGGRRHREVALAREVIFSKKQKNQIVTALQKHGWWRS